MEHSHMTTSLPFTAGGRSGEFRFFSGVVVSTDQRSDTFVSGSGRTVIYEGSGGGTNQVSTEVVVARDIWLRDSHGEEHHVRVVQDVPVRAGQQIGLIYFRGTDPRSKQVSDRLVSIFSIATNKSYAIGQADTVTILMDPKNHRKLNLGLIAAWLISLVLCVAGIGFLGVGALLVRYFLVRSKQRVVTAEVSAAVEGAHQRVLNILYEERAKVEVMPGQVAQSRLQSGSAA